MKKSFTIRVERHCHRLPREFVDTPSLDVHKSKAGQGLEQRGLMEGVLTHQRVE